MADRSEKISIGTVVEALPNATFKVRLGDDKEILGYLAGKMRLHRIKVLVGDKVRLEVDSYSDDKGRITQRL